MPGGLRTFSFRGENPSEISIYDDGDENSHEIHLAHDLSRLLEQPVQNLHRPDLHAWSLAILHQLFPLLQTLASLTCCPSLFTKTACRTYVSAFYSETHVLVIGHNKTPLSISVSCG